MALPKIQHPTHKMTLPSTKETIDFRPFLVKEEKILLMASESKDEGEMLKATKQILRNCILNEDFDVDRMTIFDMQYAFVKLRAKSVGEKADMKVVCEHCNEYNDYLLDFDALNVEIPEDLDFKIELSGGIGVNLRFPTVEILDKLTKEDMTAAENSTIMIMSCIKSIYDADSVYNPHDESLQEQTEFIESLSREDMEKLEKFTNKIPTISQEVKFNCSSCGKVNHRTIGGLSDFF